MHVEPALFGAHLAPHGGPGARWPDRPRHTDGAEYLGPDDVAERLADQCASKADQILARAGLFQGVERSAVTAVTQQLQPLEFPPGHVIFAEGEPGDRLYFIISGKVKIGRGYPDGRENLLTIMGPSDMFGELSIFDPGPRTSSATTITDVRAVSMDRLRQMNGWAKHDPRERHWHLGPIGIHPDLQGQGVGSALLSAFLKTVDQQRSPAYVETDVDRNMVLYETFGFSVIGHAEINSVNNRFMWRPARASGC